MHCSMEISPLASPSQLDSLDDHQPSQWLQTTLSEFNKKMAATMTILGGDDDDTASSPMYGEKKLQLVHMLRHLSACYCSLAAEHDRTRLKLHHLTNGAGSSTTTSSSSCTGTDKKHREGSSSGCDIASDDSDFKSERFHELVVGLMSEEARKMKHRTTTPPPQGWGFPNQGHGLLRATSTDSFEGSCPKENSWSELKLQVSKLMDENLQQQTELARRNIEKKALIDKLLSQLQHLTAENKALQECVTCFNGKENPRQIQISKRRGPILGKFFPGCA